MDTWVPALFLVSLGGLMVFYGIRAIVQARATASWPATTGTILAAEVGKVQDAATYYWVADVAFRYSVGAATYTSYRYSAAGAGFFLRRTAQRIVDRHRPGSHAVVAYPRSDPSQGILAPGAQPALVGALRIIAVGLVALCLAWKFSKGM